MYKRIIIFPEESPQNKFSTFLKKWNFHLRMKINYDYLMHNNASNVCFIYKY